MSKELWVYRNAKLTLGLIFQFWICQLYRLGSTNESFIYPELFTNSFHLSVVWSRVILKPPLLSYSFSLLSVEFSDNFALLPGAEWVFEHLTKKTFSFNLGVSHNNKKTLQSLLSLGTTWKKGPAGRTKHLKNFHPYNRPQKKDGVWLSPTDCCHVIKKTDVTNFEFEYWKEGCSRPPDILVSSTVTVHPNRF